MSDTLYVLPAEAHSVMEYQTFGDVFPGEWLPGEPVDVATLGLTGERAAQLIREHGLPLVPAGKQKAKAETN